MQHHAPLATGPKRIALLVAGFLAVVLAVIGAVLPIMPTTPFLLLAAFCFARSSARWHKWLTTNRVFGRYLVDMAQGRPLPRLVNVGMVAFCWATAAVSVLFVAPNLPTKAVSLCAAAGVTVYVLVRGRRRSAPASLAAAVPATSANSTTPTSPGRYPSH